MVPYVSIDRSVGDEPAVKFIVNTIAEFEAILVSAFGDTNEEATALAKLEKLKQGSREFSHYRSDFNTCNAIVGFTGLALRDSFRRGLSSELRDMWAGWWDANILSFEDICKRLEVLDYGIGRRRNEANAINDTRSIWV
jgi:hypothetical protein